MQSPDLKAILRVVFLELVYFVFLLYTKKKASFFSVSFVTPSSLFSMFFSVWQTQFV